MLFDKVQEPPKCGHWRSLACELAFGTSPTLFIYFLFFQFYVSRFCILRKQPKGSAQVLLRVSHSEGRDHRRKDCAKSSENIRRERGNQSTPQGLTSSRKGMIFID
jgi:hypothetical protein